MKIHLVFAPTTFPLNYGDLGKGIDPPLGILYLASYLRKYGPEGTDIKITDGQLEGFEKTLYAIVSESADIVGISAVTTNILGAYELINRVKEKLPYSKIILGGPHPTAMPEEAFEKSKVDVVVIGEGEATFTELVNFYSNRNNLPEDISEIEGLCIPLQGSPTRTKPRSFIQNLDTIPFPARDLVNMKRYTGYPISKKSPSTSILTSRGCPFNCTFCSNNVWKISRPTYRVRSVKNIVDELQELSQKGEFKEFFDYSDEFNTNISHTKDILREIINRNLSINLKCQLRAKPIDEELVQLMKKAGVWYVHLGIESGNEETLRGIRKMVTLEDVEKCCRMLKKYDIKIWGLFMYFNIWERNRQLFIEDYNQSVNTFNYAKKLYKERLIDYFGGSITTPFPGSELWDIAVRHNLIKEECIGKWDMWFYKKDLRLVSHFPGITESSIFELHQQATKYTIRTMLLGGLIRLENLRFSLLRGFYFIKRQIVMIFMKCTSNYEKIKI
ncbi:MAG: radical SAM protein [Candidatus Ratteibacteria bacterium]|nr:radical SAM protein [Candidatus Ratteibacteria bacterium]